MDDPLWYNWQLICDRVPLLLIFSLNASCEPGGGLHTDSRSLQPILRPEWQLFKRYEIGMRLSDPKERCVLDGQAK